jgi:L-alanine-DL-glutamate epimerase-like enolase superfamily enzyme
MKVTGIRVTGQTCRLSRRLARARSPAGRLTKNCCTVELFTDAGHTGIAIGQEASRQAIEKLARDLLVGADPRGVKGLWQRMGQAQSARRRAPRLHEATAALDVALWDLKSKANDEPLWKTLGGARPRARAYASGVDFALSDDELADWYGTMARKFGLRGGKLQVGHEPTTDVRRVGLMRKALMQASPEPELMIDADESWLPKQTIRRTRAMEERFDLTWVAGATRRGDATGSKRVSDAVSAAVCVGAGLATLAEFLPYFQQRSADVIQIDIGAIGITGALQLADAAFGYELPITLAAAPGNIQAHLAGALPYFMSLEVVDPIPPAQLYTSDVRIEQGAAIAGDAPGNGLALSRAAPASKPARATVRR